MRDVHGKADVLLRGALVWALAVVGAACGSKTGLSVPDAPDEPLDAGVDAGDAGTDAGGDAGPLVDECVELPYEEPPEEVLVSFEGRILAADILFLVDTTGSMTEEIDQISNTIREVLIPEMRETIPDVRFSVASLADFDFDRYGDEPDRPFVLLQESTSDAEAVRQAVDRLPMSNGADGPESQVEALYQAATGEGLGRWVPSALCPSDTVGYPCFRGEGSRIFLLFTDAEFHNGPGGDHTYSGIEPPPHTYTETVNALRGIGAKVLGLFSGGGDAAALQDLRAVARDTGAITPGGEPIVFDIGTDGRDLDEGVVGTVETLVEEVPIDIDALTEDVEGDEFDATDFVRGVEALRAEPPGGATIRGDRFDGVRPGTRVTFRVVLQNEIVPPSSEARSYLLRVVLRGDGATRLRTTVVQIVIPGMPGETCEDLGF